MKKFWIFLKLVQIYILYKKWRSYIIFKSQLKPFDSQFYFLIKMKPVCTLVFKKNIFY